MTRILIASTVAWTLRAFMLPFAVHFRHLGWRVDGAAKGVSDDLECAAAFDRVWEIDWSRSPLDLRNFSAATQVRDLVQREDYDLVHVHTPVAGFVTRFGLRRLRRLGRPRVIYTAHGFHFHPGGHSLTNAVYRLLERQAGRWTDLLVVINREDETAARAAEIVPPERLRYLPGIGVDLSQYDPALVTSADVDAVRDELGMREGDRFFLMVAELTTRKRPEDAIRALARLGMPNVHLVLAGDGPLRAHLMALVASLGLGRRVHFLGFRADVARLMRAAVALLLPSSQEGLPRSVMEAMALSTPVIASNIRGTKDLLARGCGMLVPPGDSGGLADAMVRALSEPELLRSLAAQAAVRVQDYDLRHVLDLHEKLYSEAMIRDAGEIAPGLMP